MNKLSKIFLVIIIILIIALITMTIFFFNIKKEVNMIYSVYNSTLDRLEFLENELQQEYNQNNE